MLFDAHTHLTKGSLSCPGDYHQVVSASTPEELCYLADAIKTNPRLYYTGGVHPWQSEQLSESALSPWLPAASAIGEIGMDGVWCPVDLKVQRQVFHAQLQRATELKKPIVLHTKGCEKEVLEEISLFPFPVLVHWYSSTSYLEGFLEKDCYFTIGPDFRSNPAVQRVAALAPLHRLMVESDGIEGASWAVGRELLPSDIPSLLQTLIADLAKLRGLTPKDMEDIIFQNTLAFIRSSCDKTSST